jgi:two-component system response regulator HydG
VARGEFREDLFYRLNVVALVLPPLRERGEDMVTLAEAFAKRLASQYGLPAPALSPDVRAAIRAHPWPGNVRELRNAMERALVLSPPGTIDMSELPSRRAVEPPRDGVLPFPATIRQITQAAAQAMLEMVNSNKSEAARRLGISRPRLQRILDGQADED